MNKCTHDYTTITESISLHEADSESLDNGYSKFTMVCKECGTVLNTWVGESTKRCSKTEVLFG